MYCIASHRIASHRIASHRIASHRIYMFMKLYGSPWEEIGGGGGGMFICEWYLGGVIIFEGAFGWGIWIIVICRGVFRWGHWGGNLRKEYMEGGKLHVHVPRLALYKQQRGYGTTRSILTLGDMQIRHLGMGHRKLKLKDTISYYLG